MAGSYSFVTRDQAVAQLAALLDVPISTTTFWTPDELALYLAESIRTFSALSRFYRARGTFNLVAGEPYYNLPDQLPDLMGYHVTDRDLVGLCQYHLLEPFNVSGWTGTDQFSLSDLADALTRRCNQFLLDTQIRINISGGGLTWDEATQTWDQITQTWDQLGGSTIMLPSPPIARIDLPDTILAVRHANWADGLFTNWYALWEEDAWAIDAAANSAPAQSPDSIPKLFAVVPNPQLTLRLFPAPNQSGQIEIASVNATAAFAPTTTATTIKIPDDFCWVPKWGALADLLGRDGQARDDARAKYCQARYDEGVIAARAASSLMSMQMGSAPLWIDSYTQMQAANQRWRTQRGKPKVAAVLGHNMIAFGKVPDQTYGVTADVVRNAIVPTAGSDFIQVGREEFDTILRYAKHLACFKMGGQEFLETLDAWQAMVKLGMQYNATLRANSRNLVALRDRALLDRQFLPDQVPSPERQAVAQ